MSEMPSNIPLSQDAAIVLALAETAVPFAASLEGEAERWLRVLRLHGDVGAALQALGVGEAPLESPAEPKAVRILRRRTSGEDIVEIVRDCACRLAEERGARCVSTVDVLFAVLAAYGRAFNRVLYVRGTTRDELLDCLAERAGVEG